MVRLLEVAGLKIGFDGPGGRAWPVDGVDLCLDQGQVLGLVGQSGSGKSLTALAVLGLLPRKAIIGGGRVVFGGRNLLPQTPAQRRRLLGRTMFITFQGSASALNPTMTVGRQLAETLVFGRGLARAQASTLTAELLARVQLSPEQASAYPFQLSGGMRQRVLIALALALEPVLLIADEPTTGLDMITQKTVLDLLAQQKTRPGAAMIVISHDLRAVGRLADRVVVMHRGRVVDEAPFPQLPARATHPHTRELIKASRMLSLPEDEC
jgi:ABC-type glutathione transport system ATPase component